MLALISLITAAEIYAAEITQPANAAKVVTRPVPIQCSTTLFPNVTCPMGSHGCVPRCAAGSSSNCSCGGVDPSKPPCALKPSSLRNGYPWACNVTSVTSPDKFTICDLGGRNPLSKTKKNVLMIGDSVSNGYFQEGLPGQNVPDLLNDIAASQHAPFSPGSGGAGATNHGLDCLEIYLTTASGEAVNYDVISFNFGLHDLGNTTADLQTYKTQLTAITDRLTKTGSKLIYLQTTPMMPQCCNGGPMLPSGEGAPPPKCKAGAEFQYRCDTVVVELNEIAFKIMSARKIALVNLHEVVTNVCAPKPPHIYTNCSLCRMEPCSFHYNAAGYGPIAHAVASAFRAALTGVQ